MMGVRYFLFPVLYIPLKLAQALKSENAEIRVQKNH